MIVPPMDGWIDRQLSRDKRKEKKCASTTKSKFYDPNKYLQNLSFNFPLQVRNKSHIAYQIEFTLISILLITLIIPLPCPLPSLSLTHLLYRASSGIFSNWSRAVD